MTAIRRAVVVALLAVWSFPAVGLASTEPAGPRPLPAAVTSTSAARGAAAAEGAGTPETTQLAARERQAQDLQDYRGGEGVYLYFGSGAVLVLVIVLLIILL